MSDILAQYRDDQGNLPNDKLPEVMEELQAAIIRMRQTVDLTPLDLIAVLEGHTVSVHNFLASQIMEITNELTEMWNLLGKIAGGKGHRKKNSGKDLEEMVNAMKFSRLMALYNLLKSKGGNESGLTVVGKEHRADTTR